ncbi:hypothetical protein IC235_03770 [Hymenobacter sp. BT664]|uniref:Transposase DDE domain-containing protein n=1 Tax=Hymenobacter montanus TaxID=2771359 RepID=A0A927BB13_9BACT|nr:hypothetical protein [Hymenobacter montanus]MBD2767010.1 hypothetical protein [Hymenobacter montanus]
MVDTGGLLLAGHVGPAHENDRVGYDGLPLTQWTRDHCGWRLETAPGLTGRGRFTPVPTRWVVERSISWLQWDRRLSRGYESETTAAEATMYLSSTPYPQILTGS